MCTVCGFAALSHSYFIRLYLQTACPAEPPAPYRRQTQAFHAQSYGIASPLKKSPTKLLDTSANPYCPQPAPLPSKLKRSSNRTARTAPHIQHLTRASRDSLMPIADKHTFSNQTPHHKSRLQNAAHPFDRDFGILQTALYQPQRVIRPTKPPSLL
ncbi:Uncharacterised protein [Neisseria animalis]|nr:Uncharacterised protein [Neisseria animalis]